MKNPKKALIILAILFIILVSTLGGAIADRFLGFNLLNHWFPPQQNNATPQIVEQKILNEESVVIDIAERISPTVVTVGISKTQKINSFNPLDPFSLFDTPTKEQKIEQDIGSGFVVDKNGLLITNKHVVADRQAKYRVVTADNETYEVTKIYRDPTNDLAILKINANNLPMATLGDSSNLKVGQFVTAIGTALGEFRHTVTTGVISGLGRGITAGSPFEGYVEQLDNVIQTDAAINPGNSGGPLLNSLGQVIGVNVAIAQGAQNIGFAIPINTVKDMLQNFRQTGEFSRPFLGVRYAMVTEEAAILNEVPEGAYVVEIVSKSPADKAGIKKEDIIVELDNQKIKDVKGGLAAIISQKKVGEKISVKIWRKGETIELIAELREAEE